MHAICLGYGQLRVDYSIRNFLLDFKDFLGDFSENPEKTGFKLIGDLFLDLDISIELPIGERNKILFKLILGNPIYKVPTCNSLVSIVTHIYPSWFNLADSLKNKEFEFHS